LEIPTRNGIYFIFIPVLNSFRCAIERLEESLVRLTEVALVTECGFVDSSGRGSVADRCKIHATSRLRHRLNDWADLTNGSWTTLDPFQVRREQMKDSKLN
jgi:hypothetical protein